MAATRVGDVRCSPKVQGFLQADRAEQAGVHLRGGRELRDHQGPEEPMPVLPLPEMPTTGNGARR